MHKRGQSLPSLDDYLDFLIALSNYFSKTFISIDALDELSYDEDHGPMLQMKIVEELFRLQNHKNGTSYIQLQFIPNITIRTMRSPSC